MLLDLRSLEVIIAIDTHDGGGIRSHADYKAYLDNLKKRQKAIEARAAKKKAEADELRLQIERAFRPIEAAELIVETAKPESKQTKKAEAVVAKQTEIISDLKDQLISVKQEIKTINKELIRLMDEARRAREEDDIRAIIILLH